MSNKPPVRIWCDGSYRQAHHTLGAAWVRISSEGERTEASIPLPVLKHAHAHGSDIAELTAFAMALEEIDPPQPVDVHMDCRNAIEWLSAEKMTAAGKAREPGVMSVFARALAAKKRMPKVDISFTADKNPNMARAHELSRAASTPPKDSPGKRHAHQNSKRSARP